MNLDIITIVTIIGTAAVSLGIGVIVAGTILRKNVEKKGTIMLKEAEVKAEALKNEKIMQAKEKFLQLKADHDKIISEKNQVLIANENKVKQKETTISHKLEDLQ